MQCAICNVRNAIGNTNMQHTVRSARYAVRNNAVCDAQYAIRCTQYVTYDTQYAMHSTQYAVRDTQYAICNTQYAISNLHYALRSIHHPCAKWFMQCCKRLLCERFGGNGVHVAHVFFTRVDAMQLIRIYLCGGLVARSFASCMALLTSTRHSR